MEIYVFKHNGIFNKVSAQGLKNKIGVYGKQESLIGDALEAQEEHCEDIVVLYKVECLKKGELERYQLIEKFKLSILWNNFNWHDPPKHFLGPILMKGDAVVVEVNRMEQNLTEVSFQRLRSFKNCHPKIYTSTRFQEALKVFRKNSPSVGVQK